MLFPFAPEISHLGAAAKKENSRGGLKWSSSLLGEDPVNFGEQVFIGFNLVEHLIAVHRLEDRLKQFEDGVVPVVLTLLVNESRELGCASWPYLLSHYALNNVAQRISNHLTPFSPT